MATSNAFAQLTERLKDIDQLEQAHTALTQIKKANKAIQGGTPGLKAISAVVDALVDKPGKGRPAEVGAINRSAFVMLIANFQGFVTDLHDELGHLVLKTRAASPAAVIKLVTPQRANPHVEIIDKMFSGIGIYELMDSISWQACNNGSVKTRLSGYITQRNNIVHGKKETVTKAKVLQLRQYIEKLAEKLDEKAAQKATPLLGGKSPW